MRGSSARGRAVAYTTLAESVPVSSESRVDLACARRVWARLTDPDRCAVEALPSIRITTPVACAFAAGLAALASNQGEIQQMKAAIAALREELENLTKDMEQAVRDAVKIGADEIAQLRNTASALRVELDQSVAIQTRAAKN